MAIYKTYDWTHTISPINGDISVDLIVRIQVYTDDETYLSTVKYDSSLYTNKEITLRFEGSRDSDNWLSASGLTYKGAKLFPSYSNGDTFTGPGTLRDSGEITDVKLHNSSGYVASDYPFTVFLSLSDITNGVYDKFSKQIQKSIQFESVPKFSNLICTPAYLGDEATITISRGYPNGIYSHTITYEFGEMTGTIAAETTDTTIKWVLPENFLTQFGVHETAKTGTLYCKANTFTYEDITSTYTFTALLDGDAVGPQFNLVVSDTNSATIALTGDDSKLVRYFSNAHVNTNVVVQAGTTLKDISITWGNQKIYASEGTFNAVDVDNFTIEAIDSRDFVSILPVYYTEEQFIPYSKLTCNLFKQPVSTDGELALTIEGNYFNGSFGAVDNTLTVQYRYKLKGGTYGSWITLNGTPKESNYSYSTTITGLDYRETYALQARAIDKLITIETPEILTAGTPIIDWDKDDVRFNVPVYNQEHQVFAEGKGVYGLDSSDSEVAALIPQDSIGNTVLGFGNYQYGSGDTMIYGENVHIFANNDVTVNGVSLTGGGTGVTLAQVVTALSTGYSYTPDIVSIGDNYTTASCSLILRGNCLYCRVYGSRSELSSTGDFTDELVGSFIFNHGGKITAMDYVSGIAGQSGPTAAFAIKNVVVSDETAQFEVYLTNSAAAGRNFLSAFAVPVSIDLTKF